MEDDESKAGKRYPLSASKMSKTPSWIMLGFLLGAVFVAALPPLRRKPAPEPVVFKATEPPAAPAPREPPQLTTIEAVFEVWGKHAVWSDDVTEVALWNDRDKAYTDCFEVRRFGSIHYYRTIPRLTRRVISRGKPIPESPLRFTETEEQYREWLNYGRSERPIERTRPARPTASPLPAAPAPVGREIKMDAPALPPPAIPRANDREKQPP
ncbi:MAG: hypothetical protein ACREH8_05410 [Opitutaceae bacterium]